MTPDPRDAGELEGRHDTEVAAAALQRPQQVGVLVAPAWNAPSAVTMSADTRLSMHRPYRLRSQPMPPLSGSPPTPCRRSVRRAWQARGPAWRHPRLPRWPRRRPGTSQRRHPHAAHAGQVDHLPRLGDGMPRHVVTAATDRHRLLLCTREQDRRDHVGGVPWPHDDRWTTVDHGVPDRASSIVSGIGGTSDITVAVRRESAQPRRHRTGRRFESGRSRRPSSPPRAGSSAEHLDAPPVCLIGSVSATGVGCRQRHDCIEPGQK